MSKLTSMLEKMKSFFFQYRWIFLIFLFIILIIIFASLISKKERRKKKISDDILTCPIRGVLKRKKYAADGNYTEEYQTIRLVKWLLRRGYQKEQIIFEYVIRIGRDGHNSLRVDLAVKKNGNFFVVAEVKNNSREFESAVKHQLLPAMGILNAKHAIYFDGTRKSRVYTRNNNGSLVWKPFP